ncbi:MAG: rod shape-determining protein [Oscillospiraceae bacterium]|nr:rod shape-determining protein [Oscillospiraceae bacterium]
MIFASKAIGIDLGTSNVVIYQEGRGIVLREPAVVAMDKNTGHVIKVGSAARNMLGRTPGHVAAVHPLVGGVISDYELTAKMITEMVKKVVKGAIIKPNMIVSVPSGITEVEERAVVQAVMEAGARRVYLIEEVRAAALGAHLNMSRPTGYLVVDIGGGTTDIGVAVSNEVAYSSSLKIAGMAFDQAIMDYVREKYQFTIGESTAEEIKMTIGCVIPRPSLMTMTVSGRDNRKGYPQDNLVISSEDVRMALEQPVRLILEEITRVINHLSPELAADVIKNGVTLTGGGSQIWGMDQLIANHFYTECNLADDADSCVAFGCGMALDWTNNMNDGPINIARNRRMLEY